MGAHKRGARIYYNGDIKIRYLDQRFSGSEENIRQNIERMFEKIAKYEIELNKDASCFTSLDIKDAFKQMGFVSVYLAANYRSQFSNYTLWCINQNLVPDYQNHYLEIKDFEEFVNKISAERKIISRNELLSAIENLDNPCDMYVLLALFEGINGKNRSEILSLHSYDINENNSTGHLCTGRIIKLSSKLIEIALESAKTFKYIATSGRQITFATDEDPELVFKNFGNAQDSSSDLYKGRRLYFRIIKALEIVGLEDLSITSVSDSGKIHFLNTIAKEQGITGAEALYDDSIIQRTEEQFGVSLKLKRSTFYKNYSKYLI